jgi:hypothetical protein
MISPFYLSASSSDCTQITIEQNGKFLLNQDGGHVSHAFKPVASRIPKQ